MLKLRHVLPQLDPHMRVAIFDEFGMVHDNGLTVAELPYYLIAPHQNCAIQRMGWNAEDQEFDIQIELMNDDSDLDGLDMLNDDPDWERL